MSVFRTILLSFFLSFWPLSGGAFGASCAPIQGKNADLGLVALFAEMAGKIGLFCPSSFQRTGENTYLIEYLAAGETPDNWTELLAVALVEPEHSDDASLTSKMLVDFMGFIKKNNGKGSVISKKVTKDSLGRNRVWFAVAYEMGNPPFREKNVAVIRTVKAKYIANVQYRVRKKIPTGHDLSRFLRLNGMEK